MKQRESRRKVLVPARMRSGEAWSDVCIRNISSFGMMLESAEPPARGTYIEIRRGAQVIVARAMWRQAGRFGVRTQDRIDINALIAANTPDAARAQFAQPVERRSAERPSAEQAALRADRSRQISATIQFGVIGILALAAALFAASTVRDLLSRPLAAISGHL